MWRIESAFKYSLNTMRKERWSTPYMLSSHIPFFFYYLFFIFLFFISIIISLFPLHFPPFKTKLIYAVGMFSILHTTLVSWWAISLCVCVGIHTHTYTDMHEERDERSNWFQEISWKRWGGPISWCQNPNNMSFFDLHWLCNFILH